MEAERKTLVLYRLERAREALSESALLLEGGFANTAASRLYYACFYAVSALFALENLSAKTHKGARALLGRRFVREGVIPSSLGKTYSELFDFRQEGDYEDFSAITPDQVREYGGAAHTFVEHVASLIQNALSQSE